MNIYIDGLERSGNQFITHAINYTLECETKTTRSHQLSTLQGYKKDYPFIVPVRNALPSIISAKVYREYVFVNNLYGDKNEFLSSIDNIIGRYKEYTEYLVDHPEFFIAPFHEFIKDHNKVIDVILKTYPNMYEKQKILSSEQVMEIAFNNYPDIYHPQLGNFPREEAKEKTHVIESMSANQIKKISEIQINIDKLYKRYYDLEKML